jgi:hypothetical protein
MYSQTSSEGVVVVEEGISRPWIPPQARASGSRPERLAAASGALSAVLLIVGLLLQAIAIGGVEEESRASVVARFSDGGNELWVEVGGLLVGFAVFFVLIFLGRLWVSLRSAEGESAVFSTAAVVGGALMATCLAAATAINVAGFSSYDFYDAYEVPPDTVLLLQSVFFYLLGFALVGGGVLVGATSLVAARTRVFPKWFAIVGLVLAVVCMFGTWALFVFVPLPLLVLWILVVSVLLVVREHRALATSDADLLARP